MSAHGAPSTARLLAAAGGAFAFSSALGPWTLSGIGSSISGRELASLLLSGVTAHWVPPATGIALFLIPVSGAGALLGAGIAGATGRVIMRGTALLATLLGLATAAALRWTPLTEPGWGAVCLVLAVVCWTAAGAVAWRADRRPAGSRRGLELVAMTILAAVAFAPSPARASVVAPTQGQTGACQTVEASKGAEIPVVVVLADEDERGSVATRLEGYDLLRRYLVDPPSSTAENDGWEQLPEDPGSALDALLPDAPLVVLPVGTWQPGDVAQLRNSTGALVAVADELSDPTKAALQQQIEQTYGTKIQTSAKQLKVVAERSGRSVTLSVDSLPGETVQATSLQLLGASGPVASCSGTTDLPVRITLPAGSADEDVALEATLSSTVGSVAARRAQPVKMSVPVSASTATTTTSDPADGDESGSNDQGDERGQDTSASTDDGGSSGVPLLVVVALLGLAGGAGYLIARKQPGAPPQPRAAAPWPVADPVAPRVPAPVAAPHQRRHASEPGWTAAVRAAGEVRVDDIGLGRIVPIDLPEGRVWADDTDRAIAMACWLEKKNELGEDAEPTLRIHESGRGLIGVYDGTGGSGAGIARRLRNGTELTGAYVAARLVREVTETWFTDQVESRAALAADGLVGQVGVALRDEAVGLGNTNGMKGSLHRVLPTTLAALAFDDSHADQTGVDVLWAGDSRAYALTGDEGLQVLSVDDTRETDALELIRNDQPMTNLLSADRAFTINQVRYGINRPALLIVATDGCFGYVRTPAHFEYLLLRTLLEAADAPSWGAQLVQYLAGFTADDASLSLVALGYDSFAALQRAMTPRCEFLHREHWVPFEHAEEGSADQLRDASWDAYRDRYHARVLAPGDAP